MFSLTIYFNDLYMINGIIIGNDEIKRTYLIHLIDQYSDLDIIENTDSLKNLQNSIQNYSIDFIFLFDDFDEIDVFDLVNCWHSEIGVIMISKTPELAAKCYAYRNIIDFLTLPLDAARFMNRTRWHRDIIFDQQPISEQGHVGTSGDISPGCFSNLFGTTLVPL